MKLKLKTDKCDQIGLGIEALWLNSTQMGLCAPKLSLFPIFVKTGNKATLYTHFSTSHGHLKHFQTAALL